VGAAQHSAARRATYRRSVNTWRAFGKQNTHTITGIRPFCHAKALFNGAMVTTPTVAQPQPKLDSIFGLVLHRNLEKSAIAVVTTDMRDIGKAFGVTTHALPLLQRLTTGSISGAPHQ
jgi:hypothetical protein